MKKISVYLVSLFFLFQSSAQAYSSDPKEFVHELVNEAISKLSDKNLDTKFLKEGIYILKLYKFNFSTQTKVIKIKK